jgi:membrane-bound ClpP family serine protease
LAAVPARWHLTERPATDLELAELRKRSSRSIGCAIVALVLTLGVSIGITLEFAPGVSVPSVVILSLIAVLLYSGFAQFESRLRSIAARDLKRAMV